MVVLKVDGQPGEKKEEYRRQDSQKQINKEGVLKNWIKSEWSKFDERQIALRNETETKADAESYHHIKISETSPKTFIRKQNETSISQITYQHKTQTADLDPQQLYGQSSNNNIIGRGVNTSSTQFRSHQRMSSVIFKENFDQERKRLIQI